MTTATITTVTMMTELQQRRRRRIVTVANKLVITTATATVTNENGYSGKWPRAAATAAAIAAALLPFHVRVYLFRQIVVAVDTAQRLERNGWAKRARVESSIATTVAATATATAAVTAAADYLPPGETAESCAAAATGKTCLSVVMVKA
ncbi:unnamed protein product [Phaeothamnion confervicola]